MRVEHQWRSFFGLNKAILEEHDMFRSKPNVVSVCGGICRALPFASKRNITGFITKPVTFYSKGIFIFVLCLCYLYLYSKGVLRVLYKDRISIY